MMIFLDNNGDIDRAEINLHADLFFRRENQDVQLYSEYMTIYFSNKNEPLYADLLRDVRVIMYEKEYIQTMNGHTMRADFEGKTVKTVFVKGNVSGSRKKREPSDEKNKPSKS